MSVADNYRKKNEYVLSFSGLLHHCAKPNLDNTMMSAPGMGQRWPHPLLPTPEWQGRRLSNGCMLSMKTARPFDWQRRWQPMPTFITGYVLSNLRGYSYHSLGHILHGSIWTQNTGRVKGEASPPPVSTAKVGLLPPSCSLGLWYPELWLQDLPSTPPPPPPPTQLSSTECSYLSICPKALVRFAPVLYCENWMFIAACFFF